MKIQALTTFKHHPLAMTEGDLLTVADEAGQELINLGWAMNAETGERVDGKLGNVDLSIQNSQLGLTNTRL